MARVPAQYRRRAKASPLRMPISITLAWRNVFRHRFRSAVTLAAIAFGVIGLALTGGFIADVLTQLGEAVIHSQSGHLQITRKGYLNVGSRKPEQYLIEDPDRVEAIAARDPAVSSVMARVRFPALLNNGRADLAIAVEGIDPDAEARLGSYVRIVDGRRLSGKDVDGAMVGQGVANALRLAPGDRATLVTTTLAGATNTLDVQVVGTFQTFSKEFDARTVQIPLQAARNAIETRGANAVVVVLKRTGDTEAVSRQLEDRLKASGLEVSTWQQLNDFYDKTVNLFNRQFGVLQAIILVMVLLTVNNSVNMVVFERTAEFGTMGALGNRRRRIVLLLVAEGLLLGVVGASLGVILAVVLSLIISSVGIPMPPPPNSDLGYTATIHLSLPLLAGSFGIGVLATLVAASIAALKMRNVPIVDALRHEI